MKKIVFWNGIYAVFRPLYYLCKVFGLASYSYVVERGNQSLTIDYGYLNYIFTVIWLIVYTVGMPIQILEAYSVDNVSRTSIIVYVLYIISSCTSCIVAVVWVSVIKRKTF
jgi:hypothetical protein